jgi:hypothetical protein
VCAERRGYPGFMGLTPNAFAGGRCRFATGSAPFIGCQGSIILIKSVHTA